MDRTERFYRIELLIRGRGCVSFEALRDELEVSPATLKRDLQYLRDRMDAPIVYDRDENGYRFEPGAASAGGAAAAAAGASGAGTGTGGARATSHELPGVWFSEKELHALLTMHQLIVGLDDGGVLGRHLQPLLDKVHGMLGTTGAEAQSLMRRVRIVNPARRPVPSRFFEDVGSALLSRRRLALNYYTRSKRSASERVVSPQRLMHYRNTWYLDAWCHTSEGLRRFALDAVRGARVLDERARDVALKTVEAELDKGYGVFGGARVRWASLEFTPEAAQWVAQEEWHPQQEITLHDDGGLRMRLPFTDPTELVMDILRHGPNVRVRAPADLATRVRRQLKEAAAQYGDDDRADDATNDDEPASAPAAGG
jgi:predicted DNA-binding transcriptional regulator YafY